MNYITPEIIEFKKYLSDNNISGIALDIDNTLSHTNQYWFKRFTQIIGNPENLSLDEFFEKYHLIENAPYYQTQEAKDLIVTFTNSPEFYSELEVLDNSSSFVNEVNKIFPIIAYITMRPQKVIETTQIWLDKHNFPKAKLISRPDNFNYFSAIEWKVSVLEELFPQINSLVDDSLGVADKISSNYQGKIYLYNSDVKNYRHDVNIVSCPNWECVLDKIKIDFSPIK